ncbi:FAD-dependent oxidoreductase [Campylobacter hominis]|uniref:malate dehydrogenase (quinone) n=1 Tax=Campylobacter hominis (strain ATCC BAA-381 / DSM 21671 / CCUG 45161 / LMG 19568 / NCTC 13146 / CH001A) TaxID=360107 RepID=A7I3R6_CAMHC|nr:FAD-dependent oxidoreductase [Campylobacter hominis]ABS52004.1 malate:quinone oxidoreductase (Malate dehydrogenase[acceptor]) (MQO) [Campylobacter hominis ATCC BAA-381]UAK85638.1 FAD-dependent oxidoreductase [Campylobacter hominis]SUW85667.1 malate:quinone oxidoreductase (malate dehydrogenase[acceptor]) (MQO) [Campylobacter hominis]
MEEKHYEVVVIGGGITGAALLYELARYTDIKNIALVEKYEGIATLNSKGTANSQTIHCGDIETNYTFEKAKKVKRTADMVVKYGLQYGYQNKFMFANQKMAMGVGEREVDIIKERFEIFKELYPYLELFDKEKLKEIEPKIVFDENGNERPENIISMGVQKEVYTTINYGAMAISLTENAKKQENKTCDIFLNTEVLGITHIGDKFFLRTRNNMAISANFVVVDAGAHSLWLAHRMGYGKNMGCISMAGSFYLTKQHLLNGKVYMVQNPKLPFAALHGDPDILADGCTRFGPTALALPKLERYKGLKSVPEYFQTLNFSKEVVQILWDLIKDSDIRNYVFRNYLFEIPEIGKKLFVEDAKKIVPSLKTEDIYYAKGFGGVRPQVLNRTEKKLMLGEASIDTEKGIIFNMTPSPGATSCLGNAERDVKKVCAFLNKTFDEQKFTAELVD